MTAGLPGMRFWDRVITGNYRVITIPWYITGNQGVRGRLEAVWRLERTTANPRVDQILFYSKAPHGLACESS